MKDKIVDGLLNLLTLADEVMSDPVTNINITKLPEIPGKWNLVPHCFFMDIFPIFLFETSDIYYSCI